MNISLILIAPALIIYLSSIHCEPLLGAKKLLHSVTQPTELFGGQAQCAPPCEENASCTFHPMSTHPFCECVQGFVMNRDTGRCAPDPTWCSSSADCISEGKICCRYGHCDGGSINKCLAKEPCKMAGCANGAEVDD